jgi:endonuclease G
MSTTKGFDPWFLGKKLPLPKVSKRKCAPMHNKGGYEIKYIHYSAFVHRTRRFPLMTAVNIKGQAYNAKKRVEGEPWAFSDQLPESFQVENGFYGKDQNTFDRGHMVRRVDPCWGDDATSLAAELDTFKWVNCTPQHKKLNQKGGIWYQLEQHIIEKGVKGRAAADISVFAGPVLADNDKVFKVKYNNAYLQIPVVFWKVIVWKKADGKYYAVGFMMSQWQFIKKKLIDPPERALQKAAKPKLADNYFETLEFSDHKTYQVPISAIEQQTGISFKWTNVSFPFKTKQYKAVEGVKLPKVYPYASRDIKPLSKQQVTAAVRNGLGGMLKRYELRGIKL